MSNDMVERVRVGISLAIWGLNYTPRPGFIPDERYDRSLAAARAAIEAMREPTPQMREAGDTWAEGETSVEASENIATAWRAMIDAAIASKG